MRFLNLRGEFERVRQQFTEDVLDDLRCLYITLGERVSERSRGILKQALNRYGRYDQLASRVSEAFRNDGPSLERLSQTEAAILRAIMDFELAVNSADPSWSFEAQGLRQLQDDFLLLVDYLKPWQTQSLEYICTSWGDFFLADSDRAELDQIPEEHRPEAKLIKLKPVLQPFWFFFVALCHVLQEGENELTAHDCYWLGLVDEVIGDNQLPTLRQLVEFAPPAEGKSSNRGGS